MPEEFDHTSNKKDELKFSFVNSDGKESWELTFDPWRLIGIASFVALNRMNFYKNIVGGMKKPIENVFWGGLLVSACFRVYNMKAVVKTQEDGTIRKGWSLEK
jgi:hypothetical protein